jgi:hypothetical protein
MASPPPIWMTRPQPRSRIAGTRRSIIRTPATTLFWYVSSQSCAVSVLQLRCS